MFKSLNNDAGKQCIIPVVIFPFPGLFRRRRRHATRHGRPPWRRRGVILLWRRRARRRRRRGGAATGVLIPVRIIVLCCRGFFVILLTTTPVFATYRIALLFLFMEEGKKLRAVCKRPFFSWEYKGGGGGRVYFSFISPLFCFVRLPLLISRERSALKIGFLFFILTHQGNHYGQIEWDECVPCARTETTRGFFFYTYASGKIFKV